MTKTSKEEIEELVETFSKAKQALELGMDITRQKNTKDQEKLSTFRIKMQPFLSDEEYLQISLTDVLVSLTRIEDTIKSAEQTKRDLESYITSHQKQADTIHELTAGSDKWIDVALQLKAKLELHIMNNAALKSALLWFHVMSGKQGLDSYPPEIAGVLKQITETITDGTSTDGPDGTNP